MLQRNQRFTFVALEWITNFFKPSISVKRSESHMESMQIFFLKICYVLRLIYFFRLHT